ncbi:MAG: TRAP transporter substrate-binding protein [Propylenella sp.]
MKQRILVSLAVASALAGGLFAGTANAETVLRWNNWLPPGHSQLVGVMTPWFKQVEEATKGSVKIVPTDSSLGAPPRQYDLAIDGVADVVLGISGYTPGRFKLVPIAELPLLSESGEARGVALWRVYKKYFEQANEFSDVVLLGLYSGTPGSIMTGKKPVATLADYNGLKMRVGGGMMNEVNQALGGVNVAVPAGQIYELLSQGVADGTLMGGEGYDSFKLTKVVNYVTTVPGGMYGSVWYIAMNKAAFEKLSKEEQDAIMSVSGESIASLGGGVFDAAEKVGREHMKADGVQFTVADEAFIGAIRDSTKFLTDQWLADAQTLGVDGPAALAMYQEETKKLDKPM